MKKLFCFFKENEFISSSDYGIETCPADIPLKKFLSEIEKKYFSELKILQVNFEADSEIFNNKKSLYPSAKATVFILKKFDVLTQDQLLTELNAFAVPDVKFETLESKASFIEKVKIIKKQIAAGRLYQVNLTAPLASDYTGAAESIFNKYFNELNGPYKALLPLTDQLSVISFSPELFLEKKNSTLVTRPIKGSLNSQLDFDKNLVADTKEEAELSMIVDLLRNDLNRLEAGQSSKVEKHRAALQLGYIQHTYSEISIQTEQGLPPILDCTFPGGSISGCPKTESLKVIAELEPYRRQVYTGAIGWWKNNEFSLNLAIRTFIKSENKLFYHAGCGIVFDSDAEKEWNEFILKTGKINADL